MAQSRGRAYFILVQEVLASKEKLTYVFEKVLKGRILPAFLRAGRGTVSHARAYVKEVLDGLEWPRTLPPPSKDDLLVFSGNEKRLPQICWDGSHYRPKSNQQHGRPCATKGCVCFSVFFRGRVQSAGHTTPSLERPRAVPSGSGLFLKLPELFHNSPKMFHTIWICLCSLNPFSSRMAQDHQWWSTLQRQQPRSWSWASLGGPHTTHPRTKFQVWNWTIGRRRHSTWTSVPCGWLGLVEGSHQWLGQPVVAIGPRP